MTKMYRSKRLSQVKDEPTVFLPIKVSAYTFYDQLTQSNLQAFYNQLTHANLQAQNSRLEWYCVSVVLELSVIPVSVISICPTGRLLNTPLGGRSYVESTNLPQSFQPSRLSATCSRPEAFSISQTQYGLKRISSINLYSSSSYGTQILNKLCEKTTKTAQPAAINPQILSLLSNPSRFGLPRLIEIDISNVDTDDEVRDLLDAKYREVRGIDGPLSVSASRVGIYWHKTRRASLIVFFLVLFGPVMGVEYPEVSLY